MFDYRYPLLEVVEAIEHLRESRGATNVKVCDFVRRRGRNPNDPMKVLKTVRTLNKLVEEGVLVKRGRRYLFAPKSRCNEECEDDDDDDDDDEENEEDQEDELLASSVLDDCNLMDECDECDEDDDDEDDCEDECDDECDDEEEDDEDDDEEEDEDDEDGDDDDECDDTEIAIMDEVGKSKLKLPSLEETGMAKNVSTNNGSSNNSNARSNTRNKDQKETKESKRMANTKTTHENRAPKGSGKKNTSGKSVKSQKAGRKRSIERCEIIRDDGGKKKGGETTAFCARDFLDSQRSQTRWATKDGGDQGDENMEMLDKNFSGRRRDSKSKREYAISNNHRSRSPLKGNKAALYHLNQSDELGSELLQTQMFQEPIEADMDVDLEKDLGGAGPEYERYLHSSPVGPTASDTSERDEVKGKDSFCSEHDQKPPDVKMEPVFEEESVEVVMGVDSRQSQKDRGKEKLSRATEEKQMRDDEVKAMCSFCEKKKRNS